MQLVILLMTIRKSTTITRVLSIGTDCCHLVRKSTVEKLFGASYLYLPQVLSTLYYSIASDSNIVNLRRRGKHVSDIQGTEESAESCIPIEIKQTTTPTLTSTVGYNSVDLFHLYLHYTNTALA